MKQINERTVRNIRFWRVAVVLLMLIPLLEVLILLPSLPDTIAVHWGVSGTPDRYGSRYELLIPAAIVILVGSLLIKDSFGRQPKGIKAGGLLTLAIFNVIQPMILYMTVNPQINILDLSFGRVVCGLMSLVIIVTGNYLPKVSWEYRFKRKHGFRTRYALSDENVWMHTQRFCRIWLHHSRIDRTSIGCLFAGSCLCYCADRQRDFGKHSHLLLFLEHLERNAG